MPSISRTRAVTHRQPGSAGCIPLCPLVLVIFMLMPLPVLAEAIVKVTGTDPGLSGSLFTGDALSVQLTYESDEPLRFTLKGYARGEQVVRVQSNPAPVYPAGHGEAITWLSLTEPGYMDEIRVQVTDRQWRVHQVLAEPVSLFWERGKRPTPQSRPAWVDQLNAAQQTLVHTAFQKRSENDSAVGSVLVQLMGWSIPAYLVLQIYMLRTFRGAWRKAVLVPLLLMVPLAGYTAFALLAGSNLWPLLLLYLTAPALLYLAGVGLAKLILLRRA